MALNRKQRRMQEKAAKAQGLPTKEESAELLKQAMPLIEKAHWNNVEPLIKQMLEIEPNNSQALYYQGIIENEYHKNSEKALKLFAKCRKHMNDRFDYYNNLGVALSRVGRNSEAIAAFEKSVKLSPDHVDPLSNLIGMYYNDGRKELAREIANKILSLDPTHPKALDAIASIDSLNGDVESSEKVFQELVEKYPDNKEYKYKLGVTLRQNGKLVEAYDLFQNLMIEDPTYSKAFFGFGDLLLKEKKYKEAASYYRAAIELDPNYAEPYGQLGFIQIEYFDDAEALKNIIKAIELRENDANLGSLLNNLGQCYSNLEQNDKSEETFKEVIKLDNRALAHWNISLLYQKIGKTSEAWEENEWRWKTAEFTSPVRHFPQPQWDGSSLQGKAILLHGEQGLGDEIRMASLIPEIIEMGAQITIECEPRLIKLFEQSFRGAKAIPHNYEREYEENMSGFDFQCPLGTLPRYLRPTVEDFLTKQPHGFIKPDPEKVEFWKERINALGTRPKVGIAWQSGHLTTKRSVFYATIQEQSILYALKDDVTFINLQYGDCMDDIKEAHDHYGVTIYTWDDIDMKSDLDNVFALTKNLDLTIGPSTSPIDFSASMGIPSFSYLPFKGIATQGTDKNVWYPDMRYFFKENRFDPWEPTLIRIVEEASKQLKL